MRKRNKLLMIIVSLLLCLTLISSSLVSSVFAKYVTTDTANVTTVFKKFGITVEAEVASELEQYKTVKSGGTIELTNMSFAPGDSYPNAIRLKFSGDAEVPVKVTLTVNVAYNTGSSNSNRFIVPANTGGNNTGSTTPVMPLGFTFGAFEFNPQNPNQAYQYHYANQTVVEPWQVTTTYADATDIDYAIADHILANVNFGDKTTTSSSASLIKTFAADDPVIFHTKSGNTSANINGFEFGFYWPLDCRESLDTNNDGKYEYDFQEMEMYFQSLSDVNNPNYDSTKVPKIQSMTFTITIEQIKNSELT